MEPPIDTPFTSILVGVDASRGSDEAVRQGAGLARWSGASLEVAHVFRDFGAPAVGRRADEILEEARRLARKEAVDPRTSLLVGDPPTLLEDRARGRWADLICLGSPRHPGLGDVARHALERARCSVLISREPPPGLEFPRRILCAVDGSAGAAEAARQAGGLARLSGAEIRLLHVVAREEDDGLEDGSVALERAAAAMLPWGIEPQRELALGAPGPAIAELATTGEVDLIVIGSRGLHGLRRLLLGSVSEWVSGHAERSVLVARRRPW